MLFGQEYLPYDAREIFVPITTKIFIPNHYRAEIKNQLKEIHDIHHATIYPDIKGISLQIIENIEAKYKKDCKAVFGD